MTAPRVSVLMSVLNGEAYLGDAIDSILGQTFPDFEFIIVDNGSTDRTAAIIRGYDDARIVPVTNRQTLSLSQSLNVGLARAKGIYVARLDADDVALPDRLSRQVAVLDAQPEVALVASAWTTFGEDGIAQMVPGPVPPLDHGAILTALATRNVLTHSSITFRRDVAAALGGYDETFTYCMDYDLYFRIAATHRLAVIEEPLVAVRIHGNQITRAPDWQIPRSREILRVADAARTLSFLTAAERRRARDHATRLCLRLARLSFRKLHLLDATGWLIRALRRAPATAICLAAHSLRRDRRAEPPAHHA